MAALWKIRRARCRQTMSGKGHFVVVELVIDGYRRAIVNAASRPRPWVLVGLRCFEELRQRRLTQYLSDPGRSPHLDPRLSDTPKTIVL